MKLTFFGASQTVTGSMFLLEIEDYRILIDCGFDMGKSRNADLLDQEPPLPPAFPGGIFPFEASMVSCVLLTHAHLDHSGMLPNLIRDGFEGQIFCTAPTKELTEILLYDSANLHRKKLKSLQKLKGSGAQREMVEASRTMYFEDHVSEVMERFVTISLDKPVNLTRGITATYITAGHLLGAASIYLEINAGSEKKTIGFSGDLGRFNYPLLPDPKPFPQVDYLICESTYGNRKHTDKSDPVDILAEVIQKTCVDIPGRLLIPAFSVGRTQAILYTLNKLYSDRGFSPIKVFSDSPMALQSTKVYTRYANWLNPEAQGFYRRHESLFDFQNFEYVSDPEKSKGLSDYNEPCIIVSSSGMIKGGRIEYHVRRNLENPYATILIVGYAPEGTLSHSLAHGLETVRNDGKEYNVQATIQKTDIFSGHADVEGLTQFVAQQDATKLKGIFLVHGDEKPMQDFAQLLGKKGYKYVEAPQLGNSYELE